MTKIFVNEYDKLGNCEVNESKLQANIDALRELVQDKGWTIVAEKEISYGYQLLVTDGITRIPVDLFSTGKALIQGKPGDLQTEIKSWWYSRDVPSAKPTTQSSLLDTPLDLSTTNFTGRARIGLDESGKGDYFGPLVIGAVFVDKQTEGKLISLGVRDSKLLSDNRILTLAEEIKAMCSHFVVPIEPERYNE
jgi:ribonuclease HIII